MIEIRIKANKEVVEKLLKINKTLHGYSYNDFADWDILDNQYYQLEELVDSIIDMMQGYDDLEVIYEL